MRMLRLMLVVIGVMLLSNCSGWGQQVMTSISNKHDGSSIRPQNSVATAPSNQKCNQWCHNGWCTTHCEPIEKQG